MPIHKNAEIYVSGLRYKALLKLIYAFLMLNIFSNKLSTVHSTIVFLKTQTGSGGISYGLKYQARCIANVAADSQHTSFLVGTLSLREENEVHLIQLSPSSSELTCEGFYSHLQEIWDLSVCSFNLNIFLQFKLQAVIMELLCGKSQNILSTLILLN
jgi:hypothetical protein